MPIPRDPAVVGIIILALALAARELLAVIRAQFDKRDAERKEAAKAKDLELQRQQEKEAHERENALGKLEVKIDRLSTDVRAGMERLSSAHAEQAANVAVNRSRIERLEIEVKALREAELVRATGSSCSVQAPDGGLEAAPIGVTLQPGWSGSGCHLKPCSVFRTDDGSDPTWPSACPGGPT